MNDMRILFINPNITSSITEGMAAEARRSAAAGTELVPVTATFGTLYVENRVEAAIAAHAVLDACATYSDSCHAVIISAFGDPGLHAAKELLDIPVVAARAIPGPVPDITRAKDDLKAMLLSECIKAVAEDDAEVIIATSFPARPWVCAVSTYQVFRRGVRHTIE
jgi:Asp/Glu/hydantoin racemase